jgi:hypothetical protein
LDELAPQSLHDSIEHRKRPTPFEDPLWRLIMGRLALIALFAGQKFERQNHTSTAFVRALAVFFVGHKVFQACQKEAPEPALSRVSAIEISPFEHAEEEFLREILRLIGRIAAPAQIGIQGVPVALTQRSQSSSSFLAMGIARRDYQGPPSGWKLGSSR